MSHSVNDVYVLGHLAYETDQTGTTLATFTYDSSDVPASVQVGSDPNTSPRYYYVYNGHGEVVALVDATGASVASYRYDAFGQLTPASENFGTTTWTNPYRYDGRDGVRYDGESGLYWMSVRAYDPALGRFLSRDPLGRAPLFFADQPYGYGGNNPLSNVDPSGQFMADIAPAQAHAMMRATAQKAAKASRVYVTRGRMKRNAHPTCAQIDNAKRIADDTATRLYNSIGNFHIGEFISGLTGLLSNLKKLPWWIPEGLAKAAGAIAWGVLAAILAVQAQLLVASALFKGESFEPDSFWQSPKALNDFEGSIKFQLAILGIAITVIGVVVLALASNPLTFAIGVGIAAGGLVGLIHVLQVASDGFEREKRALGYK